MQLQKEALQVNGLAKLHAWSAWPFTPGCLRAIIIVSIIQKRNAAAGSYLPQQQAAS